MKLVVARHPARQPVPRLLSGRTKNPLANPLSPCFLPDPNLMWCSWREPSCPVPSVLTERTGRFGAPLPVRCKNMGPRRHLRVPHHSVVLTDPLWGCFGRGGAVGPLLHPNTCVCSTTGQRRKVETGIYVPREVLHSFFNVGLLGSSCPQFRGR